MRERRLRFRILHVLADVSMQAFFVRCANVNQTNRSLAKFEIEIYLSSLAAESARALVHCFRNNDILSPACVCGSQLARHYKLHRTRDCYDRVKNRYEPPTNIALVNLQWDRIASVQAQVSRRSGSRARQGYPRYTLYCGRRQRISSLRRPRCELRRVRPESQGAARRAVRDIAVVAAIYLYDIRVNGSTDTPCSPLQAQNNASPDPAPVSFTTPTALDQAQDSDGRTRD